jgi:hypothetical protein
MLPGQTREVEMKSRAALGNHPLHPGVVPLPIGSFFVALALDSKGALLVGMHGADIRGTRPILDDPDAIYRVRPGAWYGWPDYSADLIPFTDAGYRPPEKFLGKGHAGVEFLIDHAASGLPRRTDLCW